MRDHRAADAFVRSALQREFSWDAHNCCTFCAGFVHAFTGVDHLRGEANVADLKAALRAVRGYGGLAAAVTSKLGEPKRPQLAQYGDVVLFTGTEGVGDSIGICVGANVLVPGPKRLEAVPLHRAHLAWSLPIDAGP